ncbi:PqqD family protein [Marininema halotolerans]|uniref:Coenzyme PQQ synthesis protein D (PqqD) n=1 Tax=Marininema halotolerans TaxID=1155944 RepID=A0A1I6PTS0_9BACL|nr:PqqD family protein [Marininema halotolerans]SFS43445.1 Coenzyme PQQ synthesis protein D (PqqD) [Marininema halotolerans]
MVGNKPSNLLTMLPILKEPFTLARTEDIEADLATLIIPRRGWLERLSIRLFNQPATIRVHMDALGSFVLRRCTGKMTVEELALALEQHFGDQAEPILPRLVTFLQIVEGNGWIRMKSKE